MKTIILTGTYNSLNRGDATMESIVLDAFKGANVFVNTPFPKIDKKFYHHGKILKSSRRNLIYGTWKLFKILCFNFLKFFHVEAMGLFFDDELHAFYRADLVIDLSGDMLTEDYGIHVAYSHYIPLLMAIFLKKKLFICAQSVGPFHFTKFLARYIFNKCELITVREKVSLDYLFGCGVKREKLMQTADLAFLLKPVANRDAAKLMKREGVNLHKPILGVSVSRLVESHYRRKNKNSAKISFFDMMSEVLDELITTLNVQVVFFSNVLGPSIAKDDRIFARKIRNVMKNKSDAFVLGKQYRPEEIKGMIGFCTGFLGARMHANIAALSSAVPVVALSYSHKSRGIMDTFGQRGFVCEIGTASKMSTIEMVVKLFEERVGISGILRKKIPAVIVDSKKNIDLIKCLLH